MPRPGDGVLEEKSQGLAGLVAKKRNKKTQLSAAQPNSAQHITATRSRPIEGGGGRRLPKLWICSPASVQDSRRWDGMGVARMSKAQVPLLPTNKN